MSNTYVFNKKGISEVIVFIVTFFVHLFFVFQMEAPQYVDEYRTFLTGEFLAGADNLSLLHTYEKQNMYYGFGQVIFYIPLFWIFDSIDLVYKAALIFNACIMSSIPVLAIKIFRVALPDVKEVAKVFLSLAVGVYSPLIYSSKTVTNETILLFVPVLVYYLIVKLLENENKYCRIVLSVALGFTSMYAYMLNGRGLAITISVFVTIVIVTLFMKNRKIEWILYGISVIIVYFINKAVKTYIIREFHQPWVGSRVTNANANLVQRLQGIDIYQAGTALLSDWGNIFYVLVVSGGLIAFLVSIIFIKKKSKTDQYLLIYPIIACCITFGMLFFVNYTAYANPSKMLLDYYIYGRYYDALIPIILIAGIIYLIRYQECTKNIFITVLGMIIICIIACTKFVRLLIETESSGIRVLNIGTISSFLNNTFATKPGHWHFIILSVAAIVLFASLYLCAKKQKVVLMAIILIGLYGYAGVVTMQECVVDSKNQQKTIDQVRDVFEQYDYVDESYKKVFYLYDGGTFRGVNIQYALRGWQVAQITMTAEEIENIDMIPDNCFILTSKDTGLGLFGNCTFLCEENEMAVYAYGENLIEALRLDSKKEELELLSCVDIDDERELILSKDKQSFGPYIMLNQGEYSVIIQGENLDIAEPLVIKDFGANIIDSIVEEQNDSTIKLSFTLDAKTDNIEVPIFNRGNEYMVVSNCTIYAADGEQVFRADGKELLCTDDSPCRYLNQNDQCVLEMMLVEKGQYILTFQGSDIETLRYVEAEDANYSLSLLKADDRQVKYELYVSDFVKNPLLEFIHEGEENAILENVTIEPLRE